MSCRPWCLALLAVALAACGSTSSADSASVSGRITDSSGHAFANAVVVVGEGATRRAVITGPSGTYAFAGLPTGAVSVHTFAPGAIYDPGHGLRPFSPGNKSRQAGQGERFPIISRVGHGAGRIADRASQAPPTPSSRS
ncbi:MAG: carboxypeptidase-like regulatory domain-containing protein [Candidatus Dormibacteria bacterium]